MSNGEVIILVAVLITMALVFVVGVQLGAL